MKPLKTLDCVFAVCDNLQKKTKIMNQLNKSTPKKKYIPNMKASIIFYFPLCCMHCTEEPDERVVTHLL